VQDVRKAFKARRWGGRKRGAEDTSLETQWFGESPWKRESGLVKSGAPRSGGWRAERKGLCQGPGRRCKCGIQGKPPARERAAGAPSGSRKLPESPGENPDFIPA